MSTKHDRATDYIQHVLDTKDWNMHELANRAGVSASTINRPMRGNVDYTLSRRTIEKIYRASGVDPSPYFHWARGVDWEKGDRPLERDKPGIRRLSFIDGSITIDATISVSEIGEFCHRLKVLAGVHMK